MTLSRSVMIDPDILKNTQCDRKYACLSGEAMCRAEPYEDRDVLLLRCMDERSCAYRRKYLGLYICTCPVNQASYSIN